MRGQEFLDKMELIEPAYVEAADIMPKKKKSIWIKCGAAAACLCLAIAGFIAIGQQNEPSQTDLSGLPPITIPELAVGGMGFEGYLYHDISELKNENPWSESSQITALPVYKNGFYDATHAGIPLGLNEAEMRERLDSAGICAETRNSFDDAAYRRGLYFGCFFHCSDRDSRRDRQWRASGQYKWKYRLPAS